MKALWYYHKESLLIPCNVDKETSYRLYDTSQIIQARKIKILRECGFSVKEIKDVFNNSSEIDDLPFYIEEKLTSLIKETKKVSLIKKSLLDETKEMRGNIMSKYEVYEKTTEEQLVISTKYIGKYEVCGIYMGELYKLAKQHSCKEPINLYWDAEHKIDASVEVCVPIKKEINVKDDIKIKKLPKTFGIATIHIGQYGEIGNAYQALHDYANSKGFELVLPSRETYLKGPGMFFIGNPNKYRTELFIPVKVK